MKYRTLGKTGLNVSEISLGTWQVGGKWGSKFNFKNAEKIINTAIDNGVNFIDTADVYSEKLSEKIVGKVVRSRSEDVYIATKCGRQLNPHNNEAYTPLVLRKFVEDSLSNFELSVLTTTLSGPGTSTLRSGPGTSTSTIRSGPGTSFST